MTDHSLASSTPTSKTLAKLIASGFGSGYSPKAPGTIGTIAAVIVWLLAQLCVPGIACSWALVIACTSAGWWAVATYLTHMPPVSDPSEKIDPSWIVIDEWAGMFIALLPCSSSHWPMVVIAFALFRFFDISKVSWVGEAEKLPLSSGIMADDIVAGIFSGIIMFGLTCTGLSL
jgi:phosphatidylglycerophosphatase A